MRVTTTTQSVLPQNCQLVQFRVKEPSGESMVLYGRYFEDDFGSNFTCMRAPFADDEREYIGRRFDPLIDVIEWEEGWE